jgi:hypothetical protein
MGSSPITRTITIIQDQSESFGLFTFSDIIKSQMLDFLICCGYLKRLKINNAIFNFLAK